MFIYIETCTENKYLHLFGILKKAFDVQEGVHGMENL
jgi:hypothetical protein